MLLGSTILDVAIGMVLLYYLLSLICSTINEWMANLFKLRANTLSEGIASLLNDTATQAVIKTFTNEPFIRFLRNRQFPELAGLTKEFYAHPLIASLGRKSKDAQPSYIAASTFVQVVLDLVVPRTGATQPLTPMEFYNKLQAILADPTHEKHGLAQMLLPLINQTDLDPRKAAQADTIREALEAAQAAFFALKNDESSTAVAQVARENIKLIESSLEKVEAEIAISWTQAQANIENYFNEVMDRTSGWYKRTVQKILVGLAILLTVLLNADSIYIANQLALNPTLRAAAVTIAQKTVAAPPSAPGVGTTPLTATATVTSSNSLTEPIHQVANTIQSINEIGYPIGWKAMPPDLGSWFLKLLGLLITAIAISMGAPFWFDLLNRVVNLRSAGEKPKAEATK